MLQRLRRFLDVRPGEGLSVLLSFLYIATVVASFLLAKPIRNGLFLKQYGPYSLVYVYARGADRADAVRAALRPCGRADRHACSSQS